MSDAWAGSHSVALALGVRQCPTYDFCIPTGAGGAAEVGPLIATAPPLRAAISLRSGASFPGSGTISGAATLSGRAVQEMFVDDLHSILAHDLWCDHHTAARLPAELLRTVV